MDIQLVSSFYSPQGDRLHLFRDEYGEGLFINRELSKLMGYTSVASILRRAELFRRNVHSRLLIGQEIRQFKQYLADECGVCDYVTSTKILFISESGLYLILSSNCSQQALQAGDWIIQFVLPLLANKDQEKTEVCYAKVHSEVLGNQITLLTHQGRIGFLARELLDFIGNGLNYIHFGYHSYVENIHLQKFDCVSQNEVRKFVDDIVLYESGLYRYLRYVSNNISLHFFCEFQEKILPSIRSGSLCWNYFSHKNETQNKLNSDFIADKVIEVMNTNVEELKQQWQRDVLRENLVMIARIDGMMKFFYELVPMLEERFADLQKAISESNVSHTIKKDESALDLSELKIIAKELGIFHLDRQTPHLVFLKALIDYSKTPLITKLRDILKREFAVEQGENWIKIKSFEYHVWMK